MKKKLSTIISIFCIGFLTCCQTSNKDFEIHLKIQKEIKVPIGADFSNFWLQAQYWKDGTNEYLVALDVVQRSPNIISFYCLNDSSKNFQFETPSEGPDGVGKIMGFLLLNRDSIFLLNSYQYTLYLNNLDGERISKYDLLEGNKISEDSALPLVFSENGMHKFGNFLYIPSIPDKTPLSSSYKKQNNLIVLDLSTGEFNYKIGYPDFFKGRFYSRDHARPTYSWIDDKVVINFLNDQNLYFGSIFELNNLQLIEAGSDEITRFLWLPSITNNREEHLELQYGSDRYQSLIYDKFRNIYYRIGVKAYDDESLANMKIRKPGMPPKNLFILLDKKLKKIGEYELPYGKYIVETSIVTKDGLLVQTATKDEDYIYFDLITFNY